MNALAVVLDRPTAAQREAVHEVLKTRGGSWWHHFANMWILRTTKSAGEVTDLVLSEITDGPASVMVLKLQPEQWSYYGLDAEGRLRWVEQNVDKLG